jgi:hypothetical protein
MGGAVRCRSGGSSYGRPMIAVLTPLLDNLGPLAVLQVMAVVFTETGLLVGFFLPGDSLLFLAGALVASHVIALPFWVLALGVFAAAVAGDQQGYLIGRRYGPTVPQPWRCCVAVREPARPQPARSPRTSCSHQPANGIGNDDDTGDGRARS